MPPEPECTFDDGIFFFFILHTLDVQFLLVAEVSTTISEGPKNKYERLENRISSSFVIYFLAPIIILKPDELEMLLRQKESDSGRGHSPSDGHLAGLPSHTSVFSYICFPYIRL